MDHLNSNTILRLASDVKVTYKSNSDIRVAINGVGIRGGGWSFPILNSFSKPITFAEALKNLRPQVTGTEDWIDLTSTIRQFCKAGIIVADKAEKAEFISGSLWFDSAKIHVRMLNDRARTAGYLSAIREVVKPGDVVIDMGTGSGVLALAAAQAGASRVYALEAGAIGKSAVANFAANGFADRITLVQGWSTQINLPERADVLVSEIIGSDPLGERVLECTADAVTRMLKPDARLLPARLLIYGLPVAIPETEISRHTFTDKSIKKWQRWYGMDFSPMVSIAKQNPPLLYVKSVRARRFDALAEPVLLADVDFRAAKELVIDNSRTVQACRSARLNGVIVYFELELSPRVRLSTAPSSAGVTNNWSTQVFCLPEALQLREGDPLRITYRHRTPGAKAGVTVELF